MFLLLSGINDIIKTAEFFFKKIVENVSIIELPFYLFGFTVATRSIPDHLLHDYYVKFFGKIIEDHIELMKVEPYKLYPRDFREKAKEPGHEMALAFIEHWEKQMDKFEKDEKINFLFRMRDISVHRKIASRPHFIIVRNGKKGFGLEYRASDKPILFDDGIAFCEYCLNEMKLFVHRTKSKF